MRCLDPKETKVKILSLLDEKGITINELSNKIGASNPNLYKYLRGNTASIRADTLAGIALGLGVSCDDLLTDTTGGRITSASVSDYLGLSESSVRWIRSLPEIQKTGLDTCASKRLRIPFGALLQLIGEDLLSPVTSDREYLLFRACRVVCNLFKRL